MYLGTDELFMIQKPEDFGQGIGKENLFDYIGHQNGKI